MKNQLKNKLFIKNILMLIALIVFSVNLYADDEKPKFKSMHPEFYETPTRFITIIVNGYRGVKSTKNIGCGILIIMKSIKSR